MPSQVAAAVVDYVSDLPGVFDCCQKDKGLLYLCTVMLLNSCWF